MEQVKEEKRIKLEEDI